MPQPHLLSLMTWLSPAFPTGGFSYSHGLEWLVEEGSVCDEATSLAWLTTVLCRGSGRNDALLFLAAWEAADDLEALAEVARLAAALPGTAEWWLETTAQGEAFARAIAAGWPTLTLEINAGSVAYPVAVGGICGRAGIDPDVSLGAFLQAVAAHLISAAVRLVPLGQSTAQRLSAAVNALIPGCVEDAFRAGLADIGSATIRLDLASMAHETQYTRLFRS